MFTLVTKKSAARHVISYLAITIFCMAFTYVYELFSYGESSTYMRLMFLAPLAGLIIYFLTALGWSWVQNQASKLLLNSAIAVTASACLVKGIVEVSGRTTSVDTPYWYVAGILALASFMFGIFKPRKIA